MAAIKIFKVTSLPTVLEPHSLYLTAPASNPEHTELYVTGSDTTVVKRIININDVQAMVGAAFIGANSFDIVDNIAARDALPLTGNRLVLVTDATGDPTVASGAATYAYRQATNTWIKISEYESLDIVINWNSVQNRPNSTPVDIDLAVSQKHSHANTNALDKITENVMGDFQYGNDYPRTRLELAEW